jgi:alpha-galactosidase
VKAKPTITVIGAASTTFGPKVLRDILNHPQVGGCTFRFVDLNEERLAIYDRLARRLNEVLERPVSIQSTTKRREALAGSDYVILSVDTGHYKTWELDFSIPARLGVRQVLGELGGPGGLFHSLRQIPVHLDITRDIEALCSQAMVMVCSNPLNRICLALERHARVGQIVGLCHGVEMALYLYLNRVLGIEGDDMEVTAAGTNHFTWILDLRRRSSGEDLYPLMRERLAEIEMDDQPLSRKLLEVYGVFPGCLDSHIGEYIPYAYEFCGLEGLNFDGHLEQEEKRWHYLRDLAEDRVAWDTYARYLRDFGTDSDSGDTSAQAGDQAVLSEELRLDDFFGPRSWADTLAFPIIAAIESHTLHRMPAVNMLNCGTITNLPRDIFVETPAVVDGSGIRPICIGELPQPLAAFCRRDIDQMELAVEAAVTGDRNLVLQAMLLDPVVDSVRVAERVLDEMLKAHADCLPQFS